MEFKSYSRLMIKVDVPWSMVKYCSPARVDHVPGGLVVKAYIYIYMRKL